MPHPVVLSCVQITRTCVQVLALGDHVVAAARQPDKAAELLRLKAQYGSALQLVALDADDWASTEACPSPWPWND
jgi:uncharacterized protein YbjT (DUF2867 family)